MYLNFPLHLSSVIFHVCRCREMAFNAEAFSDYPWVKCQLSNSTGPASLLAFPKMSIKFQLIFLACLLTLVIAKEGKPKKLQIGVKKRVENCTVKSKRGDLLHMHYRVLPTFYKLYFRIISSIEGYVNFSCLGYTRRWN